jgi:redox-sensitive bicupin YhaK (pirin superfamily)
MRIKMVGRDFIEVEGETIAPGEMLYLGLSRSTIVMRSAGAAHLLPIGGQPFAEDVLMWWNFVGRTTEEMVKATEDWNASPHSGSESGRHAHSRE